MQALGGAEMLGESDAYPALKHWRLHLSVPQSAGGTES